MKRVPQKGGVRMTTKTSIKKPATYQVPKANHPWRQYANKKRGRRPERTDVITIQEFLSQIVDNWDTYEIYDRDAFSEGAFRKVRAMPQRKIAIWLAAQVKKTYVDEL